MNIKSSGKRSAA